ncbi:hypothetical protein N665_0179s0003 [Sinapis alba]|nr:hypothetical protein N665_0179s0003 [Sinapis alba]
MFETTCKPDVIMFNTLMNGLCYEGRVVEAVALLDRMVEDDGLHPDQITYVDGMCKMGHIVYALNLLRKMEEVSHIKSKVVIYNTASSCINQTNNTNAIIDGFWKDGCHCDAENVFSEMQKKRIFPYIVTYNCLINGFCSSGRWSAAQRLLQEMLERKINPYVVTFSVLINALVKEGNFANKIVLLLQSICFIRWLPRAALQTYSLANTITYNTIIHGFCQVGDLNTALHLLQEMISSGVCPNIVTYNTLLDGLCDNRKLKDALEMFRVMQKSKMDLDANHPFNGVEFDVQTYNILISGLINEGMFLEAEELYEEMPHRGIVSSTFTYNNSMVDGLCKQTRLDEAEQMFISMGSKGFSPDVVTFTTFINGYCKMCRRGIVANPVTYITLIHGFRKVGNISGALDIFQEMISSGECHDTITIRNMLTDSIIKSPANHFVK